MQNISKISVVNAPNIPQSLNVPQNFPDNITSNIDAGLSKKIPSVPSPNVGNISDISNKLPAIPNANNVGNVLGVPSTVIQPKKLNLPKIPAIPALGESGISNGGGPKFLSEIIKKNISIITGI